MSTKSSRTLTPSGSGFPLDCLLIQFYECVESGHTVTHSHTVTLSHCHTVSLSRLSHCHTVTLSHCPYCHTVTQSLSHCHTVTQSHCHTVTQSYCHTVTQSHCPDCLTVTQSHPDYSIIYPISKLSGPSYLKWVSGTSPNIHY